eukprot:SAG31_NODE_1537_length_7982_cov_2.277813_8_plen_64_part_00
MGFAGDIVILDAISKEGLIEKTEFVFLDTLHLVRPAASALSLVHLHSGPICIVHSDHPYNEAE